MSVYGTDGHPTGLGAFLGSGVSIALRGENRLSSSGLDGSGAADLPTAPTYTLEPGRPSPGRPNLLRPPVARVARDDQYGNIDPFSIGYAFRPHLRIRLTLS